MRNAKDRVWEEFNKRRGRLKNAHNSINQRISQGNRLREGVGQFFIHLLIRQANRFCFQISSVVGIEQNENISMLTWITILYLPLAFITVSTRTQGGFVA